LAGSAALTTGSSDTIVGYLAGLSSNGTNITIVGANSGSAAGDNNTIVGANSAYLTLSLSSTQNVIVGSNNCTFSSSISNNVIVGDGCCDSMTTASNNVVVGQGSGTSLATGGSNIVIGQGSNTTGTTGSNVIIGGSANVDSVARTGAILISSLAAQNTQAADGSVSIQGGVANAGLFTNSIVNSVTYPSGNIPLVYNSGGNNQIQRTPNLKTLLVTAAGTTLTTAQSGTTVLITNTGGAYSIVLPARVIGTWFRFITGGTTPIAANVTINTPTAGIIVGTLNNGSTQVSFAFITNAIFTSPNSLPGDSILVISRSNGGNWMIEGHAHTAGAFTVS
jgi:hypothetical protein